MFKAKKEKIDHTVVDTIISETVTIEGKIIAETSIEINGRIIGDIVSAGNVTIGEKGIINANITARELLIAGIVRGNVKATEKLIIKPKGKLIGETNAKSLIIEQGGTFLGRSNMETDNIAGDRETDIDRNNAQNEDVDTDKETAKTEEN